MSYVSWVPAFEDSPSGNDPGSVIDNKFNELKEQIRRLLQAAGINMPDIGPTEDGTTPHTPGNLVDLPGVIAVDAGGSGIGGQIWNSLGNQILMDPTDTGVAFPLVATGGNITSGANPGHQHDITLAIPIGTSTGGLIPGLVYENRGNGDLVLVEARLIAGVAPVGGNLNVQMRLLPVAWTDPAATGIEVWADPNRPTLVTTEQRGVVASTIADGTLEEGEAWTFEVDTDGGSPNGAEDVTLILHVTRN